MIFTEPRELNPDFNGDRWRQGPFLVNQEPISGWKCAIVSFGIEAQFCFFARGWLYRARVSAETLADRQSFRASILRQSGYLLSDRELSHLYDHNGLLHQLLFRARKEMAAEQVKQMEAAE